MSSIFPPKPSPLVPGYRLDRYELLCPIAEGGMAAVWLARQGGKHGFQKLVAVKTILPQFLSEPDFRALFLDEARLASRIDHPNVAQVLDLGEEHEVLYLVIEWVDGDSLNKLAKAVSRKSERLPQAILLRVLSDACLGLHAAHELRDDAGKHLGVVHRDVSPQNILVSAHGTSTVIDFGIAKARDRLTQETRTGVVKGKLDYMSPEQALGMAVDLRTDIWAIGAVFYRIVTGKSPYDAASPMDTMELLRTGKLVNPLSAVSGVHPAVCKVIERALTPWAAGRFATAAELHDALEAAMIEAGVCASATEVQAFLATHLGERMSARKKAVRIALEAADHREKLTAALEPCTRDSGSAIAALGAAGGPEAPPGHTSVTRRVTSADQSAKTRAIHEARPNASLVQPSTPLEGAIEGLDEAGSPPEPPTHTGITRREGAPQVDVPSTARHSNDAPSNGSLAPRRGRSLLSAVRLPRRRTWLSLAFVLGMGSILGARTLVRAPTDATSSSTAPGIVDSIEASPPAPSAFQSTIPPPSARTTATDLPAPTGDPHSPRAWSSAESARKRAVPPPDVAHRRLPPRAGTSSPRPPTQDADGI